MQPCTQRTGPVPGSHLPLRWLVVGSAGMLVCWGITVLLTQPSFTGLTRRPGPEPRGCSVNSRLLTRPYFLGSGLCITPAGMQPPPPSLHPHESCCPPLSRRPHHVPRLPGLPSHHSPSVHGASGPSPSRPSACLGGPRMGEPNPSKISAADGHSEQLAVCVHSLPRPCGQHPQSNPCPKSPTLSHSGSPDCLWALYGGSALCPYVYLWAVLPVS